MPTKRRKRRSNSNRRLTAVLVGVIVILIGVIGFIAIEWDNAHLRECWSYYASVIIGSGGLISILPTVIDAYRTRNFDIILDDIKDLINGKRTDTSDRKSKSDSGSGSPK